MGRHTKKKRLNLLRSLGRQPLPAAMADYEDDFEAGQCPVRVCNVSRRARIWNETRCMGCRLPGLQLYEEEEKDVVCTCGAWKRSALQAAHASLVVLRVVFSRQRHGLLKFAHTHLFSLLCFQKVKI